MIALQIQLLNKKHDRKNFSCGEPNLDQYLQLFASQDIKRNISRIFVAIQKDKPEQIIGFFSLSANSLDANELPETIKKKLPGYPVPIALLGRLAVDRYFQHKGVGKILLSEALQKVYYASQAMAVYAVVVEALDNNAKNFYQKFGFITFPNKPITLFLPMQTIKKLMPV